MRIFANSQRDRPIAFTDGGIPMRASQIRSFARRDRASVATPPTGPRKHENLRRLGVPTASNEGASAPIGAFTDRRPFAFVLSRTLPIRLVREVAA